MAGPGAGLGMLGLGARQQRLSRFDGLSGLGAITARAKAGGSLPRLGEATSRFWRARPAQRTGQHLQPAAAAMRDCRR